MLALWCLRLHKARRSCRPAVSDLQNLPDLSGKPGCRRQSDDEQAMQIVCEAHYSPVTYLHPLTLIGIWRRYHSE